MNDHIVPRDTPTPGFDPDDIGQGDCELCDVNYAYRHRLQWWQDRRLVRVLVVLAVLLVLEMLLHRFDYTHYEGHYSRLDRWTGHVEFWGSDASGRYSWGN